MSETGGLGHTQSNRSDQNAMLTQLNIHRLPPPAQPTALQQLNLLTKREEKKKISVAVQIPPLIRMNLLARSKDNIYRQQYYCNPSSLALFLRIKRTITLAGA